VRRRRSSRLTRLLVCEGPKDKFFFERLIDVRGLPRFYIVDAGGNSGFARAINGFRVERTSDFNSLRNILIVADNNELPAVRFKNVCDQVDAVFGSGTAPAAPLQASRRTATRSIAITILMIPWTNEHGHLERLCVDAARDADRNTANHVDEFMALIHAERWNNESRFGKAWLRTILAARCERDPFIPLGSIFSEQRYQHLIPVNHPSFNKISNLLNNL
jgi:hypothetical protein